MLGKNIYINAEQLERARSHIEVEDLIRARLGFTANSHNPTSNNVN